MSKHNIEYLTFEPPLGLASPHVQTILGSFCPPGPPPPSSPLVVPLDDTDALCCEVSTPPCWQPKDKTIVMLHGLGGSHNSCYMVRISRKFYNAGYKVVRINMRGCGSGDTLANRPYHGGISEDILNVLKMLKTEFPQSPIIPIGFSLGGNIILKLIGELGDSASALIDTTFAICPPIDLAQTAAILVRPSNRYYNQYYMKQLELQAHRWIQGRTFSNLYEFDCLVTAPHWGFQGAFDYYQKCSSRFLLPHIKHQCHILFAADDPFIDYHWALGAPLPSWVKIWISPFGGHMGFLSWSGREHYYYWLDNLLLKWIKEGVS